MRQRNWLITDIDSGFGRALAGQLLERGDRVLGTVRDTVKGADSARVAKPLPAYADNPAHGFLRMLDGAREHSGDPAQADRGVRGADSARGVHGFPAGAVSL